MLLKQWLCVTQMLIMSLFEQIQHIFSPYKWFWVTRNFVNTLWQHIEENIFYQSRNNTLFLSQLMFSVVCYEHPSLWVKNSLLQSTQQLSTAGFSAWPLMGAVVVTSVVNIVSCDHICFRSVVAPEFGCECVMLRSTAAHSRGLSCFTQSVEENLSSHILVIL